MDESFGAESITDVGDPALVQAPSIEIERGAVLAGRYQVEAVIGKGGSGVVLRAFDRVTESLVAIKILRPDLARDPRWVERFSRELRLGRQIQHPNVCRIFDIGEADGHRFLTMELATGGTLRDGIDDKSRTLSERIADARALLSGLAAIHGAGIVHRDVKPENLLRMTDGRLVLSDFGLATNPGDAPVTTIMVGTPSYMAPEIVMGAPATPRSDVWAAGVVMHEILLGFRPERPKPGDRRPAKSASRRPLSRIEKTVGHVCWSCMHEDQDSRPADATAVERLLGAATNNPLRFDYRRKFRTSLPAWGLIAAFVAVTAFAIRHRLWTRAGASSTTQEIYVVAATGQPKDWTGESTVVANLEGQVHCVGILPGGEKARLIWGSPRRAEDIDLKTGSRVASPLSPATYRFDCPQLSPSGNTLLFTSATDKQPAHIVLAKPDGSDGKPLITGSDSIWLPNGEEFLFNLDASHVAIFSVPTMSFSLLSTADADVKRHVHEKTLNARGDRAAVVYNDNEGNRLLVVYALPSVDVVARWRLGRSASQVAFHDDALLLSDMSRVSAVASLDWRSGTLVRLGFLPGTRRLAVVSIPDHESLLVAQKRGVDIWAFDDEHPEGRQITSDGESYRASQSPSGDVLVQSRMADGRLVIVRYGRSGRVTRLTEGPTDCEPSFARDGSAWLYSDYQRKVIRLCRGAECRDLRQHNLLPSLPVMSPDGRHVAFATQIGSPRLHLVGADGSNERDLGPTALECPAVWTGPSTIWSFSGAGSTREWREIDVTTGRKTGRSKAAVTFDPDKLACGWESDPPESPFFQTVRPILRETTQLRRIHAM